MTSAALALWGVLMVFLLLLWFGRESERTLRGALAGTLPVMPLALVLGTVAGATQLAVAAAFGPELPNIAAGFTVLGLGVLLVRRGLLVPGHTWDFPAPGSWPAAWRGNAGGTVDQERPAEAAGAPSMSVLLAWTPYLIVALVLIVTRWPGLGLDLWLRERSLDVARIAGQDLSFSLRYLYLPGVIPFIPVALLTAVLHRMDGRAVAAAWRTSIRQIVLPAVTLIVAVSMTQVMIQSATNTLGMPGMMEALSQAAARGAGPLLPAMAPWIGTLGTFMTGSTTSSNVLFAALQHDAAAEVGISRTVVVALQNTGGGIGTNLRQTSNITLAADASIGGTGDWALLTSGYGATTLDHSAKNLYVKN
jgi:lactate permease